MSFPRAPFPELSGRRTFVAGASFGIGLGGAVTPEPDSWAAVSKTSLSSNDYRTAE